MEEFEMQWICQEQVISELMFSGTHLSSSGMCKTNLRYQPVQRDQVMIRELVINMKDQPVQRDQVMINDLVFHQICPVGPE